MKANERHLIPPPTLLRHNASNIQHESNYFDSQAPKICRILAAVFSVDHKNHQAFVDHIDDKLYRMHQPKRDTLLYQLSRISERDDNAYCVNQIKLITDE